MPDQQEALRCLHEWAASMTEPIKHAPDHPISVAGRVLATPATPEDSSVDGDAEDAARYRWLLSPESNGKNVVDDAQRELVYAAWTALWLTEEDPTPDKRVVDAAIDAARTTTTAEGGGK